MAPITNNHVAALLNIGANDASAAEAAWKANVNSVLDAIHAKFPTALVYITKPWRRDAVAAMNTLAGWIDTVVAGRAFARAGDDERTWMEGGDNGATNTTDGIHYSVAGQTAAAAQKQAILGY